MNSSSKFQRLVATLFGGFRQEVTPERIDAYVLAVADLPYDFVRRAVVHAIRNDKWMPSAAELRTHTKALMPKPKNPETLRILEQGRRRIKRLPAPPQAKKFEETPKPAMSATELERSRQDVLAAIEEVDS